MTILSNEDWKFFKKNGYVIVPKALPQKNLNAVIDAMYDFLGMTHDNPEGWYHEPLRTNGMVEMYHHQAMWDNRQH
nr:hypothetical protein [Candidatus Poribacteria bacterium]